MNNDSVVVENVTTITTVTEVAMGVIAKLIDQGILPDNFEPGSAGRDLAAALFVTNLNLEDDEDES